MLGWLRTRTRNIFIYAIFAVIILAFTFSLGGGGGLTGAAFGRFPARRFSPSFSPAPCSSSGSWSASPPMSSSRARCVPSRVAMGWSTPSRWER